jgi:hypothetical protein
MLCCSLVILFIVINFTLKIMDMRLRERKQSVNASASSKIKHTSPLTESKMRNYY